MKRLNKAMVATLAGISILSVGVATTAMANNDTSVELGAVQMQVTEGEVSQEEITGFIRIYGTVLSVSETSIVINNTSGISSPGEMVLHIDKEQTRLLDAVNANPLEVAQIQVGDMIYAYIQPAMTMSLPPQSGAQMIIGAIPADFAVPTYVAFDQVSTDDNGNVVVKANNGDTYTVSTNTQILPYLTRNIVTMNDIKTGGEGLIWMDMEGNTAKVVLFPMEHPKNEDGTLVGPGAFLQ